MRTKSEKNHCCHSAARLLKTSAAWRAWILVPRNTNWLCELEKNVVVAWRRERPEEVQSLVRPLQTVLLIVCQAAAQHCRWVAMGLVQLLILKGLILEDRDRYSALKRVGGGHTLLSRLDKFSGIFSYINQKCIELHYSITIVCLVFSPSFE